MTTVERPIHRGISDFAIWVLVNTKGSAILAGRKVTILEATPSMVHRDGWYNVKVQEEGGEPFWMDVTTSEYESREQDIRKAQARHRAERKKRRKLAE